METVSIAVKADEAIGEMYRFWSVANWNRPHRMLEEKYQKRLKGYAPFVTEVNLVYILGGRIPYINNWYKGVDADGNVIADYTGLVAQIRATLDHGYTPWIVLDNVPYEMAKNSVENFYGNTEPPADFDQWHQYVKGAIEALVDAFGKEAAESWWYRVGTEPDLNPGHWTGTKEEYFKHYDYTADAVLSVLPDAMYGPGNILNPVEGEYGLIVEDQWGLDIIDHCANGKNYYTGETGTVMRWFSTSWYTRVGLPSYMFDKAIRLMQERIDKYPQLGQVPLVIGEFTVLHDENGVRLYSGDTTEWSASFYAGLADRVYKYGVHKIYEWHHGTQGVLHPKGHVIAMMERMAGGERLAVDPVIEQDVERGVIACRNDGQLYLLVYHHDKERDPGEAVQFEVTVEGCGCTKLAEEWTVSKEHASWAYVFEQDCAAAGIENNPKAGRYEGGFEYSYGEAGFELFEKDKQKYLKLSTLPQTDDASVAFDGDIAKVSVTMPGHCVRLIVLE